MLQLAPSSTLRYTRAGLSGSFLIYSATQNAIIRVDWLHAGHSLQQSVMVVEVIEVFSAGRINRSCGPRLRGALLSWLGNGSEHEVEEDKIWFDAVAGRNADKLRETLLEPRES